MLHLAQRLLAFHAATLLIVARGFQSASLPEIVSVPDLHGDYERTVQVLEAAGMIDKSGAWSGGSTTLVQTGDIVDRGPDSQKIYKLFGRLATEAPKQGGRVVNMLGNHEEMNIQGDFRYVNKKEMQSAGGPDGWRKLWQPDSELGQQVRKFKVAAKVGSVLFVHAGLLPTFLKQGRTLEDVNRDMATALADDEGLQSSQYRDLLGDSGPLWTRFYADTDSQELCKTLAQVLKQVGAERMVVGHTLQETTPGSEVYRVNPVCHGSLILADTAISRAYGGEMSFIQYHADGEAVVNYPGLGLKQVLPSLHLSPQVSVNAEDMKPATVPKALRTQSIKAPGSYASRSTYLNICVFCLVVAGLFLLIRSCCIGRQRQHQKWFENPP